MHVYDTFMERQLDRAAGAMLKEAFERRGLNGITGGLREIARITIAGYCIFSAFMWA